MEMFRLIVPGNPLRYGKFDDNFNVFRRCDVFQYERGGQEIAYQTQHSIAFALIITRLGHRVDSIGIISHY